MSLWKKDGGVKDKTSYAALRRKMVEKQIIKRSVKDPLVLSAMRSVPRHEFVPESQRRQAYEDHPLPIGEDQTISQPYIVALMTELLGLKGSERVLEVGTGSGYQAAVLAEIVQEVYTIEILESLMESARERFKRLCYNNIHVKHGDAYAGWPDEAPFDGIIVTAASTKIPEPLVDQLVLGGRLVIPVGDFHQELVVITNKEGVEEKRVIPVRFVPMTGQIQKIEDIDKKRGINNEE
jgi:protein-L-isoaspartate(D-aspartate) O-methyltransferase